MFFNICCCLLNKTLFITKFKVFDKLDILGTNNDNENMYFAVYTGWFKRIEQN